MTVTIGGGTGFIGSALAQALTKKGHAVQLVSRSKSKLIKHGSQVLPRITWIELKQNGLPSNCKAVVNLAGANLLDVTQRNWTKYKHEVYSSRIETTQALVDAIDRATSKPEVFVSASAVGYYKPSETAQYDEDSADVSGNPNDFMSQLCVDWEAAAQLPNQQLRAQVRHVAVRFGVVLGRTGGIIKSSFAPFYFGVGGRIGSGRQWLPWIHLDDLVGILLMAVEQRQVSGVLNGTAPNPVTNAEFANAFAHALGRPALFPMPEIVVKQIFGSERARVVLEGQYVLPKRTLAYGYKYKYPDITSACKEVARLSLTDEERMRSQ